MKKLVLVLILAILIAGSVFAEEGDEVIKNWVSVDLGIFGIGVGYEYMLLSNLSVGANAYTSTMFFSGGAGIIAYGRYYIFNKNFYTELGLGYGSSKSMASGHHIENKADTPSGGTGTASVATTGLLISPGLGWKIDRGEPGGFFIQPGFKFPIAIGKLTPWASMPKYGDYSDWEYDEQTGTKMGFIFFFSMGYAF